MMEFLNLLSFFIVIKCCLCETNLYSFKVNDVSGNEVDLSKYRGKALLIVNVASECGFTDNHYKELTEIDNLFNNNDFEILAFPCNQFGEQEPKKSSAILRFAQDKYNIKFTIFGKVKTIGTDAHPLFKWLKATTGDEPQWNFGKYLIDRHGNAVKYISQFTAPMELTSPIYKLINWDTLEKESKSEF